METFFAILPFFLIIIIGFFRYVIIKPDNDYKNRYFIIPLYSIAAFSLIINTYQEFSKGKSMGIVILLVYGGFTLYFRIKKQRAIELEKRKNEGFIN